MIYLKTLNLGLRRLVSKSHATTMVACRNADSERCFYRAGLKHAHHAAHLHSEIGKRKQIRRLHFLYVFIFFTCGFWKVFRETVFMKTFWRKNRGTGAKPLKKQHQPQKNRGDVAEETGITSMKKRLPIIAQFDPSCAHQVLVNHWELLGMGCK